MSYLKLPRLSNKEYDIAAKYIEASGYNPIQCPTCKSMPDEFGEREFGTYIYKSEERSCQCDEQLLLRRHYALACIGRQYQILNWNDYQGPAEVKFQVGDFIENFEHYKDHGMGVELYAVEMGVGKTFAAIHIGKELVKQGHKVMFINFPDMVERLVKETDQCLRERLKAAHVLIIDDINPSYTDAQNNLFSNILESVVRHRTDWNMPIITTTNLKPDDLKFYYPRIYSILSAKQHQIEMPGSDRRDNMIRETNENLAMAKENKPIT